MRNTFTLLSLASSLALAAQPTLLQSNIASGGLAFDMYVLSDPGDAEYPTDGLNQTWDLSGVTLTESGTLAFVPASNTPYAASYPAANWAWAQTVTGVGPDVIYLDISATGIEVVARGVPMNVVSYSDPSRIVEFPMDYGDSFQDAYTGTGVNGTPTWTYSGHGTLITPLGTTANVAKVVSDEGDMLLWNTAPLYPLVIDNGEYILFYGLDPTNAVQDVSAEAAPTVYPNPAENTLWMDGAMGTGSWSIMDMQGRQLRTGRSTPGTQALDVEGLATGSYLLALRDGAGHRTVRFMKQ
ncbi:MAG TPA: T9SS type A sorting domain-containing protein [Flavobacteriales bacterium]|nr:T9SS type A sorting domain-containing protein [Flavobacteriales bacterium]HNU57524.1 T9SS type A sorting domain-containing protein [Flavobacteriales bacterium]